MQKAKPILKPADQIAAIFNQSSVRIGLVLVLVGMLFGFSAQAKSQPLTNQKDQIKGISDVFFPTNGPAEQTIGDAQISSAEEVLVGVRVPILYYHYIEVNPNPQGDPARNSLLVTPTNFEAQLQYLKDNGWTTVTLDDLVSYIANPALMPSKPVILTFDDGYQDFYANAWPLLRKYNDKATIYVLSRGGHPGACGNNFYQPNFYMSDGELRELAGSSLITVASHSQDHCSLKKKPESVQWQEILNSKKELEGIIGKPVRHFAYPYGSFDDTSVRIAKESGYETAATTISGTVNNESTLYTLHRIRIGNLSLQWFASQLAK